MTYSQIINTGFEFTIRNERANFRHTNIFSYYTLPVFHQNLSRLTNARGISVYLKLWFKKKNVCRAQNQ